MALVNISAFDAAQGMLETACSLYINNTNYTPAHVLACSCAEVLNRLLVYGNKTSVFEVLKTDNTALGPHPFGGDATFEKAHNAHVNFFKHGGFTEVHGTRRSSDGKFILPNVEFDDDVTLFILLEAMCAFHQLGRDLLPLGSLPLHPSTLALSLYFIGAFESLPYFSGYRKAWSESTPELINVINTAKVVHGLGNPNVRQAFLHDIREGGRRLKRTSLLMFCFEALAVAAKEYNQSLNASNDDAISK